MPRLLPAILAGGSLALASLAAPVVPTASAALVINEIDYDQPFTDAAEFIELKNTGPGAINLSGYAVVLVNGTGGGAAIYETITLGSFSLAAGDYYVLCANAGNTANCDLDVTTNTNWVQNGAPDAVGLRDPAGVLIDAVSYEGNTGAPYTEGTGLVTGDNDVAFLGISRFPDGVDTNNNNTDWSLRCITPGAANAVASTNCEPPVPTLPATWGAVKAVYR